MESDNIAIPGVPQVPLPEPVIELGSPEEQHLIASERTEASAAWAKAFANSALTYPPDLLAAARLAAVQRGWELHLSVGQQVVGRVTSGRAQGLSGPKRRDVTAALIEAFLGAVALESELGMPLFPQRGKRIIRLMPGAAERELPKTVWRAEEAKTLLDTLASRYGFKAERGVITDEGGTVRYRREGYAMDLSASFVPERKHFVFSGIVARIFKNCDPLEHDIPVLEYNEYAERHQNRFYRDHAVLFSDDLANAIKFLSVPTQDGWSYGEIIHFDAGKGFGFISNAQADSIFFRQEQVRMKGWVPLVGDRVRFRCQNVVQQHKKRSSAYRATHISRVDERVAMDEFLR